MKKKLHSLIYVFLLLICFFYYYLRPVNREFISPAIPNSSLQLIKLNYSPEKNELVKSFVGDDAEKVYDFYRKFQKREFKNFSQNGEDGVIQEILNLLNMVHNGFYVEIGVQDGTETNTRNLRENFKWSGIQFDMNDQNKKINLKMETVLPYNVLDIFKKYGITDNIDLLSQDTDYADYWIIERILTKYRPKIIVHEVNQEPPESCVSVPNPRGLIIWDNASKYYGASVCAFYCLAKRNNYTMVYCESAGVNCFWIRDDLVKQILKVNITIIKKILHPKHLFKKSRFEYSEKRKEWHKLDNCLEN